MRNSFLQHIAQRTQFINELLVYSVLIALSYTTAASFTMLSFRASDEVTMPYFFIGSVVDSSLFCRLHPTKTTRQISIFGFADHKLVLPLVFEQAAAVGIPCDFQPAADGQIIDIQRCAYHAVRRLHTIHLAVVAHEGLQSG